MLSSEPNSYGSSVDHLLLLHTKDKLDSTGLSASGGMGRFLHLVMSFAPWWETDILTEKM